MASGYGLAGGPSRCFPFWQEVLACYVVNTNSSDDSGKKKCIAPLEDYYECLHHRKEIARARHLAEAYRRAEQGMDRSQAPSAGEVRSLGLIKGDRDEKGVPDAPILPSLAKR